MINARLVILHNNYEGGGEHIANENCWCLPTVYKSEEVPDGSIAFVQQEPKKTN